MATIHDPKIKIFILYLGDIFELLKSHGLHTNVTDLNFNVRIILKKYKISEIFFKEKNVIEDYAIRIMDMVRLDRNFTNLF